MSTYFEEHIKTLIARDRDEPKYHHPPDPALSTDEAYNKWLDQQLEFRKQIEKMAELLYRTYKEAEDALEGS